MKGKEFRRSPSTTWWLAKKSYTLFMLREFTAVFVAGYAIFLMVLVYQASQGQDAFRAFVEGLKSPVSIVLHLLALAMALYHTVTWFSVTPKVMAFWRGEERIPASAIIASIPYTLARYTVQGWGTLTRRGAAARLADTTSAPAVAATLLRAWGAALVLVPRMLARRRRLRSLRRLTAAEWRHMIRPYRLGLRELALKD